MTDGALSKQRFRKRSLSLHVISVASAVSIFDDVAGTLEVLNDAERCSFGDVEARSYLAQPDTGIGGDAQQRARVIR